MEDDDYYSRRRVMGHSTGDDMVSKCLNSPGLEFDPVSLRTVEGYLNPRIHFNPFYANSIL